MHIYISNILKQKGNSMNILKQKGNSMIIPKKIVFCVTIMCQSLHQHKKYKH